MFINDLMTEYSPSTIKQIYLLLQEGFERAVKDKIIKYSPVIDIEIPQVVPNTMMSVGVYNILNEIYNETLKKESQVEESNFVFINTKGNPIVGDCLRGRLDDLLTRHKLKGVSLHRFRHTFATRLYEAKVKLKNIQSLLGHSTVQMTERYLHVEEEEQTDSIEQLENYYEKLGICV